jgi:hypothetical protein
MKFLSRFGLIGIIALGAAAVSSLAIASQFKTSPNAQSRTANLVVARSSVQETTTSRLTPLQNLAKATPENSGLGRSTALKDPTCR